MALDARLASRREPKQPGAVILKVPTVAPTPEDLRWKKRVEDATYNALPNIRAASEKWAATISAVTGVFAIFALVKGRDDITKLSHGWEIAVASILAGATLLAVRAILLAAVAAQGTPARLRIDVSSVRELYERAARAAADELRYSRILTVLATLLVATAIGLAWFAPEPAEGGPSNVLAFGTDGRVLACGTLSTTKARALAITPPGADKPQTLLPAALRAIVPVDDCPG
jgi:hypothetical protein